MITSRLGKFALIGVVVISLFFVGSILWINMFSKSWIEAKASAMLRRPVTFERIRTSSVFDLNIEGLNIEGLLWAPQARIRWRPWSMAAGHLASVELNQPVLTLHLNSEHQIIWAEHYDEPETVAPAAQPASSASVSRSAVRPFIDVLAVRGGRIYFPVHSEGEADSAYFLSDTAVLARQVPLAAQAADVHFDFSGLVGGDGVAFSGDRLRGSGWINWPQRNMDAAFEVVNPQGKMDVTVNLHAVNNDMTVRGHVKTRRMGLKSDAADERSMEHLLLEAIHEAGMEVSLEFSFSTRMDRWELHNIDFSGNLNASDEPKTGSQKIEDLKNIGREARTVGEKLIEQNKK